MRLGLLALLLMAGVAFSAYTPSASYPSFGKSVSLNIAFNNRTLYSLSNTDDFAAASAGGLVLGIAAPNAFGTRRETILSDSAHTYKIELRRPLKDARFFLAFTKGDSTAISGKTEGIKLLGMLGRTFGDLSASMPETANIFLRLEYTDVNILGRLYLGPGARKIGIMNSGRDGKGVTNITIEPVA